MPALLCLTAVLVAVLHLAGLPAAFLIGALGAAMIVAGRGTTLKLPEWAFAVAQAVVGCLIARVFTPALFHSIVEHAALFAGAVLAVLLVATALGLVLARARVLPGSTALWGVFPGGATVMVLLSGSFGGDMRLVAIMQYLRVVVVAVTASVVARVAGLGVGTKQAVPWLAPITSPGSFAVLVVIIIAAAALMPRVRLPAGALLGPMVLTTFLQDVGLVKVELPTPLLVVSYLVVGWAIGLRFTRESFANAAKRMPHILGAIVGLVAACAGIGFVFARIAHLDFLTGYLATSPGGADSIAIIASGTPIDVALVMAAQTARFMTVLLLGPPLAKRAVRFIPGGST